MGFDWVACWRTYAREFGWTPDEIMDRMTFARFYAFAFANQKFTLTGAGQATATMEDLRDQINRRRAEKGLPPMKPTPK